MLSWIKPKVRQLFSNKYRMEIEDGKLVYKFGNDKISKAGDIFILLTHIVGMDENFSILIYDKWKNAIRNLSFKLSIGDDFNNEIADVTLYLTKDFEIYVKIINESNLPTEKVIGAVKIKLNYILIEQTLNLYADQMLKFTLNEKSKYLITNFKTLKLNKDKFSLIIDDFFNSVEELINLEETPLDLLNKNDINQLGEVMNKFLYIPKDGIKNLTKEDIERLAEKLTKFILYIKSVYEDKTSFDFNKIPDEFKVKVKIIEKEQR